MTELEAAITREQLKKLRGLVDKRIENVQYLSDKLSKIPFISPVKVRDGVKHVYYIQPLKFNSAKAGIHRNLFIDAVKAELMPIQKRENEGVWMNYGVKPIYSLPIFQKKICYGSGGYPFTSPLNNTNQNYSKGSCPIAERLHEKELFYHDYIKPCMTKKDLDDVVKCFYKVAENIEELKNN
jgi:dTDP-4-amino-4,6-dideoxygalactose transaminase